MLNMYTQPEDFGLKIIGEVEWEKYYAYDKTVIFKDVSTGQLYIGEDEGCSCPSPFQDKGRIDLTPVERSQQFIDVLLNRNRDILYPESRTQAAELVLKAKHEFRNWQARQRRTAQKTPDIHKEPITPDPKISPEEAAHVLGYYGRGGFPPGDWTYSLISVMDRADRTHFAKLCSVFPGYGEAIRQFKYDENGIGQLLAVASDFRKGTQ